LSVIYGLVCLKLAVEKCALSRLASMLAGVYIAGVWWYETTVWIDC